MRDTRDMFDPPERGRFGDNERQIRPGRGPRVTGASDLIDLVLTLRQEKPLAIAVTDPAGPQSRWIWLPKSQIEIEKIGKQTIKVAIPEWLAKEKELVC